MCFSATASFTAAGVLATVGCLSIKAASSPQLRLMALIPLFFAVQQLFEGITWITLTPELINSIFHIIGIYGFLFFAGIFWPIWIPFTLFQLERNSFRKSLFKVNLAIGAFVAACIGLIMLVIGQEAEILAQHISYPLLSNSFNHYLVSDTGTGYFFLMGLYVWVVVGSCFISTVPYLWHFGLLTGLAFVITQMFYAYAFESIWCYFAAIISGLIFFIIHELEQKGY